MIRSQRLFLTLVLAVIAISIPVFVAPLMFLVDDALFYPQVAYNVVRTGYSTFNTITPTNGYHPLWMVVNIVSMAFAGDHRMRGLHIELVFELMILILTIYFYRKWVEAMGLGRTLMGTAIVVGVLCSSFWGMESHLTILLVILCGVQYLRLNDSSTAKSWLLFGALLGCMVLSRLDDVFIAFALITFAAFDRNVTLFAKKVLLAGLPCLLVLLPYLVFNKLTFGHAMPVSGAIKSCFPHISGHLRNIGSLGQCSALFAIVGLVAAPKSIIPTKVRLVRALCVGVLAQLAYIVLFTNDPSTKSFWYYATAGLTCALVTDVIVSALPQKLSELRGLLITRGCWLLAALIIVTGITRSWLKISGINFNPMNPQPIRHVLENSDQRFEERLARWMQTSLPPSARIITVDFPGRIAFLTDASVVPLDGLIGDYRYNDEIVTKGIGEFISRTHISYYLGPICDSEAPRPYSYFSTTLCTSTKSEEVQISSPLYRTPAGSFFVQRKDLLLDINQAFGSTLGHGHLGVWRISNDGVPLPNGFN